MTNVFFFNVSVTYEIYRALMRKRSEMGDDLPVSIVVRRLLAQVLGVPTKRKGAR